MAGYEDQNDHDTLCCDPVFKLVAGRRPSDDDLASQPTMSRFENSIDVRSLRALQDVLIDQFLASFAEPPRRLTLDIDTFDDPTHGQQQRTFFHGYYEQYQYQPRAITCADNDLVMMVCLLHGSAHPALGADRLSDHRYLANLFRLHLHTAAYNLLVRVRQVAAAPPSPAQLDPELPLEARTPDQKRRYFNRRRRDDPLGEGHACTWRLLLIKVAARVRESARRIVVELSGSWPHLANYAQVSDRVLAWPQRLHADPD